MKRMRGRNHRSGGGGGGGGGGGFRNQQNGIPLNRNHVFDSSGPESRVRGTAQQLFEKYTQLARDAASNSDRVLSEAFYQHAEHYFRIISAINQAQGQPNDFGRRETEGGEGGEAPVQVQAPRQENQNREPREYREPRENRENREPRENRDNREPRENRDNRQERRFEPRQRPEFQPRDRGDRPQRPAPAPIAEAPIDISSALEAELAASIGAPEPAGFGEQPHVPMNPPRPAPVAAPEPVAIPIVVAEPPAPAPAPTPAPAPELTLEEPAAPVKRPRGRPRKVEVETPPTEG